MSSPYTLYFRCKPGLFTFPSVFKLLLYYLRGQSLSQFKLSLYSHLPIQFDFIKTRKFPILCHRFIGRAKAAELSLPITDSYRFINWNYKPQGWCFQLLFLFNGLSSSAHWRTWLGVWGPQSTPGYSWFIVQLNGCFCTSDFSPILWS